MARHSLDVATDLAGNIASGKLLNRVAYLSERYGWATLSSHEWAGRLNLSQRQIRRAVLHLKNAGLVETRTVPHGPSQTTALRPTPRALQLMAPRRGGDLPLGGQVLPGETCPSAGKSSGETCPFAGKSENTGQSIKPSRGKEMEASDDPENKPLTYKRITKGEASAGSKAQHVLGAKRSADAAAAAAGAVRSLEDLVAARPSIASARAVWATAFQSSLGRKAWDWRPADQAAVKRIIGSAREPLRLLADVLADWSDMSARVELLVGKRAPDWPQVWFIDRYLEAVESWWMGRAERAPAGETDGGAEQKYIVVGGVRLKVGGSEF